MGTQSYTLVADPNLTVNVEHAVGDGGRDYCVIATWKERKIGQ